jgi:hypothetical protein
MEKIYKAVLNMAEKRVVTGPGFVPLAVGEQDNNVVLWYRHVPDALASSPHKHIVRCVMTGESPAAGVYVGTVQMRGLVLHVFVELNA